MKRLISFAILALPCSIACASNFDETLRSLGLDVHRLPYGSGTPAAAQTEGTEHATHVVDGLFHAPNYLPGHPTAATLWPRELAIECDDVASGNRPLCKGYAVHPATGRGEYLFIRPIVKAVAPPPQALPPAKPCVEDRLPVTRKKPLG